MSFRGVGRQIILLLDRARLAVSLVSSLYAKLS